MDICFVFTKEKVDSQQKLIDSLTEVNQNRQEEKQEKYNKNSERIKSLQEKHKLKKEETLCLEEQMGDIEPQKSLFVNYVRVNPIKSLN